MKFPYLKHPRSGLPDVMVTITVFTVLAAITRFLLDDVTLTIAGHALSVGHMDPLAYGSLLTPVLGVHGYVDTRPSRSETPLNLRASAKVDNPDLE